ncbi:MAG: pyridoxal-phosphate dependent enzyme [Bacteroidales bacterium]|nr:pyridoxal-phosphate dependent enzyme [Bacteroidales bacterium]
MKYQLVCKNCGKVIGDFATWFQQDQKCRCGSTYAEVEYLEQPSLPQDFVTECSSNYQELYFSLLPLLRRENIVSIGEGTVPIERWTHLEAVARKQYINCKVYVVRNDLNAGSGTFKDISAALAASVLKENGVKDYCLASTGNAGTAFATYLAKAGIHFTEFAPSFIDKKSVETIRGCGQDCVISAGGYGDAKKEAAAFHNDSHILISGGNTDPLRIESKRTLVFECLRQLGFIPSVYMQAVAGGTSPLAFDKGVRDLNKMYPQRHYQLPRMLLVQQDECDPMVTAWEHAAAECFPHGWEQQYEAKKDVHTHIGILTAANPGNYPLVAPLVCSSRGTFLRVAEAELPAYAKMMQKKQGVTLGAASLVCYAGFFQALKEGVIHDRDTVLLNIGESNQRSEWPNEITIHEE